MLLTHTDPFKKWVGGLGSKTGHMFSPYRNQFKTGRSRVGLAGRFQIPIPSLDGTPR